MEINPFHVSHLLILCLFVAGDNFARGAPAPPKNMINTRGVTVNYGIRSLNRSVFPTGFVFGTASSAYQYEGRAHDDGRGLSIWDTYTHNFPERIKDRSTGDMADDSYHQYMEDIKVMKYMEVDAYRLSISWPRVLPHGKLSKGVNQKGLLYYHKLIDALLANGIQPYVTIFHWDLPQVLENEYGGVLSRRFVDDYRNFAELCFKEYGQKVKHWITMNEPWTYSVYGYDLGAFAPGRCSEWIKNNCTAGDSSTEPYLTTHNLLLAHAAAVNLYKSKYQGIQKGTIGITVVSHWFIPFTSAKHDVNAASRSLDFMVGWFMDPIAKGEYPASMRALVGERLPKFTMEESRMLKGSFDFVGINYYTSRYAIDAPDLKNSPPHWSIDFLANLTGERHGKLLGPQAATRDFYTYPKGLHDLLVYMKKKYNNPVLYVTETGTDEANDDTLSLKQSLNDKHRIKFYHEHLASVLRAIREGADVRGFFPWTLLDNFEWSAGYSERFGINFVDRKHGLKRYPKLSAHWFKRFLHKTTR